ncbi:MAG: hypothetical protein KDA24_15570 [Deltaproteobacteria bacterium]|nr:hypothetical protein [Deltaproteobacteria bacterium]
MATTSTADHALPALTPSVLALLLSCSVVIGLSGRTFEASGGAGPWWGVWLLAAGAALVASFRSALPAIPGKAVGAIWLLAGALGGAILGRHALLSLMGAWGDLAVDAAALPGLAAGDLLLVAALLLPSFPIALASRLRSPRPALLLLSLVGLVPLLILLGPVLADGVPTPATPPDPSAALSALTVPAALLWITVLPGPASLPLSARRPLLHHWLPRLLTAAVLVGLPAVLLHASGRALREAGALPLGEPGRRLFGRWGFEVGAGMECLVAVVAALVVLVLCARIAARSLPRLRSGVFPAMALAAGLCAAWLPPSLLLAGAALTGWIAVLWGVEPDGVTPPPLMEPPHAH